MICAAELTAHKTAASVPILLWDEPGCDMVGFGTRKTFDVAHAMENLSLKKRNNSIICGYLGGRYPRVLYHRIGYPGPSG